MLRMLLLGLLIPFGIGVLAAMELRTPPRATVAAVRPPAETTVGLSDSHAALAKADRLDMAEPKSELLAQPAPVLEPVAAPEAKPSAPSEVPKIVKRDKPNPKPKKVIATALPKPKPKAATVKRTTVPERQKTASDSVFCRLSAFGGLRKALNTSGCEI